MEETDMQPKHDNDVDTPLHPPSTENKVTSRTRSGRRRLLKSTVVLTGGVVSAGYVTPDLRSFGSAVALAIGSTPTEPPRDKDRRNDFGGGVRIKDRRKDFGG